MRKFNLLTINVFFALLFLSSCSKDDSKPDNPDKPNKPPEVVRQGANSIKIALSGSSKSLKHIIVGDGISVKVTSDKGDDITSFCNFSIGGINQSNNNFIVPSKPGKYKIKATFSSQSGLLSDELTVNAENFRATFQKNVLIEDYTGANCEWCPRVIYAIEQVEKQTKFVVPIAIHTGEFSTSLMANELTAKLLKKVVESSRKERVIFSFPTAYVDRVKWRAPEPNNIIKAINFTKDPSALGLALESKIRGNKITVTVKAMFGRNFLSPLKINVFVLEDGIIEDMKNSTSYFGGNGKKSITVKDFKFNDVLRYSLTEDDVNGDVIDSSETIVSEDSRVYSKEFSVTIKNTEKSSNMRFVALITSDDGKKVLNVRDVKVGSSNNFEKLGGK